MDTWRSEHRAVLGSREAGNNAASLLSPIGSISDAQEIVDAVVFLAEAPLITGEVLHVDGGAHLGQ
jgi:NAD(P)-dependent dehydrogenase (short-subunit alcohol dehydrogenase family)